MSSNRSLHPKSKRDVMIVSQLWKCDQIARKIAGYSGLGFEELRDVAREYLIKIYDSWDESKANFSTWVNRCLNFYMMNYLRDKSRLVRIPRSYSDLYLKIRKLQKKHPDWKEPEIAECLDLPVKRIQAVIEAFSMKFSGTAEMCHYIDTENLDEDSGDLDHLFGGKYKQLLLNITNLSEKEEAFLTDYLVKKRSYKTLLKNYSHLQTCEEIKEYSKILIEKILADD